MRRDEPYPFHSARPGDLPQPKQEEKSPQTLPLEFPAHHSPNQPCDGLVFSDEVPAAAHDGALMFHDEIETVRPVEKLLKLAPLIGLEEIRRVGIEHSKTIIAIG